MSRPLVGWVMTVCGFISIPRRQDNAVRGAGLISANGAEVLGVNSHFLSEVSVGDSLAYDGCGFLNWGLVASVLSDHKLLLAAPLEKPPPSPTGYMVQKKQSMSDVFTDVEAALEKG
jgi:hypothetical protein